MLKFVTGNQSKFKEAQAILNPIRIKRVNLNLEEIQELDSKAILRHKLKEALKHEKGEVFVEDVSLCFECLGDKLPGPLIKWFNSSIGNEGLVRLSAMLKNQRATFKVLVGYARNPEHIRFFEGKITGKIVRPRGNGGFNFDPIFLPKGSKKTLAELKTANSLNLNARGEAIRKLKTYLLKNRL